MSVTSSFAYPVPTPNPAYRGQSAGYPSKYQYNTNTSTYDTSRLSWDSPRAIYTSPTPVSKYNTGQSTPRTLTPTLPPASPTPTNNQPTNNTGGVNPNDANSIKENFPGYAGWNDPNAIIADFRATGGAGKGGGGSPSVPKVIQPKVIQPKVIQPEVIQPEVPQVDPNAALNEAYSGYFSQLDEMLNNYLPSQRTSQEGVVNSQFNQGLSNIDLQKSQGLQTLERQRSEAATNQEKTLKDLSSNLRNSFMAGNVYLGSRGAGDSSAANQYSYALTKLGNQQRADILGQTNQIMQEINDRESALNDMYNNEKNNLQETLNQNLNQIGQWFAGQQQNIAGLKGQALLQKSQQLYDEGIRAIELAKQQAAQKQSLLDQWAVNNATTMNQLKQNFSAATAGEFNLPQNVPLVGNPVTDAGGNLNQSGYIPGSVANEKDKLGLTTRYNPFSADYFLRKP